MNVPGFHLSYAVPPLDDYLRLRPLAGLSPHERASAEVGLANSCVAVTVHREGVVIGMGRVIGDGGLNFQVVDIAVDPAFHGRGGGQGNYAGADGSVGGNRAGPRLCQPDRGW